MSGGERQRINLARGLSANIRVAREGASVAGDARKKIESKTGKPVLTGRNAKSLKKITK